MREDSVLSYRDSRRLRSRKTRMGAKAAGLETINLEIKLEPGKRKNWAY